MLPSRPQTAMIDRSLGYSELWQRACPNSDNRKRRCYTHQQDLFAEINFPHYLYKLGSSAEIVPCGNNDFLSYSVPFFEKLSSKEEGGSTPSIFQISDPGKDAGVGSRSGSRADLPCGQM